MDETQQLLKADRWQDIPNTPSDQNRGVPAPPLQKPAPPDAELIDLIPAKDFTIGRAPLLDVIEKRRSRRRFAKASLTLEELSFLLWATQGVQGTMREGTSTQRTVPSGGARHPFETYLWVNRVDGLAPGLYRYLALDHKLCLLRRDESLRDSVVEACNGQEFVGESAVTFIWAAIPYRTQWRYTIVSPKLIAQDSGHVCQNLYLAAESIGAGTCAIGAYHQQKMDEFLGLDGVEEFVIYAAPVGKIE